MNRGKVPPQDADLTNSESLSYKIAETLAGIIRQKPNCALGLPTGRTPLHCYRILREWPEFLDWSQVRCFSLDEYFDVEPEQTFGHYLETHLYRHVNVSRSNVFTAVQYDNYDELIGRCGGLDYILLGIGRNGHIAFNEPGTPLDSWTHCAWLDESTRMANQEFFGSLENVPQKAVTMGIRTILSSRRLALLAVGESKRDVLNLAMTGPICSEVPASFLRIHEHLEVLADFDW